MFSRDIFDIYMDMFPKATSTVCTYFPNGKDSIRIKNIDGESLVFTFHDKNYWKLESLDSFVGTLLESRSRLQEEIISI